MYTWRTRWSARMAGTLATLVVCMLLSALVPGSAQAADVQPVRRWIVVLKNSVTDPGAVAAEQTGSLNAPVREVLNLTASAGGEALKGYVVEATQGQINAIRTDPRVDFAEPDATVRAPEPPTRTTPVPAPTAQGGRPQPGNGTVCEPNDFFFTEGLQPELRLIRAPEGSLCTRVPFAVAVLDTGIDLDHEDLAASIAGSVNFSDSPTADDLNGHGSHVAGTIGAVTNNGIGIASVTSGTRLFNVKVLNDDMSGSVENVARGLYWVARNAGFIRIANLSLTTPTDSRVLRRAVRVATRAGVTLVAAAGNLGTTQVLYPAGYPEVISVAAVRVDDIAFFSTRGRWVDIAAPGVEIVSTSIDDEYGFLSGTSMAAPFVSGGAAACLAIRRCGSGHVEAQLGRDADRVPGTGTDFRYGRLNVRCYRQNAPNCPSTAPGRGKVISKKPLHVRKQPTTRSAAVGTLRPGQIITIDCKTKGQRVKGNNIWYRLGQNPRGWAAARYVKNLDSIPYCTAP